MVFAALRFDLVVTPLTGSQLDVAEAIKAAQMAEAFGKRAGKPLLFRCLVTRVPAALRPRSLGMVVAELRRRQIDILPTAIIEKEAFRDLFAHGGGLAALAQRGVYGVAAAHHNARAYVGDVVNALESA
jgi:chromosome partitioning protein